ncbi:MAG: ATP-dependent DNA helicase RecG [Rickettsiales bacterium]|nr:ATP-dependent DNA helicase RecG [Rickettsiales bacterium]
MIREKPLKDATKQGGYKEVKSNVLLAPLSKLNRVGPTLFEHMNRLLGGDKIIDLLLHQPSKIENISICPKLFEIQDDELVILKVKVEKHVKPEKPRQPYKIVCYAPSGYVSLVFFKIFPSQLAKMAVGKELAVMGRINKTLAESQISHPQEILPAGEIEKLAKKDVVYPLTYGLTNKFLVQKIRDVLSKINDNNDDEWVDKNLKDQSQWPSFFMALKNVHSPSDSKDFLPSNPSRKRLAFDELLSWQLAVLLAKKSQQKTKEYVKADTNLVADFLNTLPFKPTHSQVKAINEIKAEIASNKKMLRLLQGDVGSGKTIVSIASALQTISQKKQACIIAPTTVLAKQHFSYFSEMLKDSGLHIALLTGSITKKQKQHLIGTLKDNKVDILIGTHAVLEDDVEFSDLGLAVIDEQHRFGVMQRLKLVDKGVGVDVLLMSATPIPRSLMMALYGNMDISILSEKPKNRQYIETLVMSQNKQADIHEAIKRAMTKKEKIYWVCPAIEENEELEMANVSAKFEELGKIFGKNKIALLHGRMKDKEKESVLNEFSDVESDIRLIVTTTVIEVGIDVSNATAIVIENSENFGLSQLHQLRGRVGRSDKKSYCILLYGKKFGPKQRERLNVMRHSNDGFFIAEEDLKLRGSGELLGTKQSGFPEFRIANLNVDSELLKIANKNAQVILGKDQNLQSEESQKYRDLLRLFGYDECLKMVGC